MENVIDSYLKCVKNFLQTFYKTLLKGSYSSKLVSPFIEKYILVRYYNNTVYEKETDFISRVTKELTLSAKEMITSEPKQEENIKNIVALFSYILYIDDCVKCTSISSILKLLFEDKNIKLEYDEETKEELKKVVNDFTDKKKEFYKLFDDDEFELNYKRIKRNLNYVTLKHNIKFSALYSDYAIDKAFNSGTVNENKYLLMYYLLSEKILTDIVSLDYHKNYIVDLPISLLDKSKKLNRYLVVLDNDIIKEKVHIRYTYKEYKKNKEIVNKLINMGYSVAVELDDTFDNDFECLVLFSYVFVYEKYDYYDLIVDAEDKLNINYITM